MAAPGNIRAARTSAKEILQKVDKAVRSPAGPKRWFWELLQNAIDSIATEPLRKVNITVTLGEDEESKINTLQFVHNGAPFRETKNELLYADDFENLICPVSGKSGEDKNTVGKFGTGFLSTHSLSLIIDVEGILLTNSGERYKLKTTLDRTAYIERTEKNAEIRINGILDSLEAYDKMKSVKEKPDSEEDYTKFTYHLFDTDSINKVRTGFKEIEQSLPVVLTLNDKVDSVTIKDNFNANHYVYKKGLPSKYKQIDIQSTEKFNSDGQLINTFYIASIKNDTTTLCWPIERCLDGTLKMKNGKNLYKESLNGEMPILYCTFPLIGSDKLYFPVILNSYSFAPNETRNGVSLTTETITKKDTNSIEDIDLNNRTYIESGIKLYKNFLENIASECDNLFFISKLNNTPNVEWIDEEWYKDKIEKPLRNIVKNSAIIDVSNDKADRKSIINEDGKVQIYFPNNKNGKLETRKLYNTLFYRFSKDLFTNKIPLEKDLENWHHILWDDDHDIKILEVEDILSEVASYGSIAALSEKLLYDNDNKTYTWLSELFQFVVKQRGIELLSEYVVVPNQNNNFKKFDELYCEDIAEPIPDPFIDVLKNLGDDWRDDLLHREIKFDTGTHDKLTLLEINNKIDDILNEEKEEYGNKVKVFPKRRDALKHIVDILKIDSLESSKEAFRHKIFFILKDLFSLQDELLPTLKSSKFKYSATLRIAIFLINEKISSKENIENLSKHINKDDYGTIAWLSNYLSLIGDESSDYKRFLKVGNMVPNRKNKLCAYEDLLNFGTDEQPLNESLINILNRFEKKASTGKDYWDNLVAENIELKMPNTLQFDEVGSAISQHITSIKGKEVYEVFRTPLLELIDWCAVEKTLAQRYLPGFKEISNRIFFILTIENSSYSSNIIEILKNDENIEMLSIIKESGITKEQLNEFIGLFEEGIPENVMKYAKEDARKKKEFNNLLEVGSKVESLFIKTLESYKITSDREKIIHAGGGAYDIRVYNPVNKKSFYIELKSCRHQNTDPINIAVSQAKRAVKELENKSFSIVIIERSGNNEMDENYIRANTKYFKNPGKHLGVIGENFDTIENSSNTNNDVDLKMDFAEFKGSLDYKWVLNKIGDSGFDELLVDIKNILSA
ncbi:sacsin N-terminal ATP-binding-like domain-containing protein [Zunongwangia sp. HRR-M8]|uniref:sacsin N-terminal ATP-binding-like domain-containing protein n=1 Tax=Zunongwangia sp. HRR-M8 TaxID=3015170 RepID=UPI0022DE265E|nr:hypothetical protein [Zunongwangia sp. HRR-M8]WBL23546.1 hypothetical protein PBT89_06190 [Zunongwangia sp. HRR-M8]